MKKSKKIGIAILVLLIGIQFVPTTENKSDSIHKEDFIAIYNPPNDIQTTLKTSCYDCHSNNTHYPWYSKIQPCGMFLGGHIKGAKSELNFNEFGAYSAKEKDHKVADIIEMIEENKMPMSSYTFAHREAVLTSKQKSDFILWMEDLRNKL